MDRGLVEWVGLTTGAKAVPQPVATHVIWSSAFGGALLLTSVCTLFGGVGRPTVALIVLALLAALLGMRARLVAAPGTALMCWLFLNGFAIPPAGRLTLVAPRDAIWLGCLLAASVAGTVLARLVHARAAYRRMTPHGQGRGSRSRGRSFKA